MDITTRTHNDITVVAIAGQLDSNTSPAAQKAVDEVLARGQNKVLFDFTKLDYISSAGLRVMLGTAKKATVGLFGLNDSVREVFDISGFSTILAVSRTEEDALRKF